MFVDASDSIESNPPMHASAIAVADANADGCFEFLVAGYGCSNRLLRWAGGQLRDAAPPSLADSTRLSIGLAAGDIDGDGREEIYVVNLDVGTDDDRSADRLFKAQLDGSWEDLFALPGNRQVRNASTGRCVAALDRRGVGRYGFFVANRDRPMRFYELGQGGILADLANPLGLAVSSEVNGLLALPIFSDQTDIICTNEAGPNFAFRNRGDGTFEECAAELGLCDATESGRSIAAIDSGGGGELGICWSNCEGAHRAMIRQTEGIWKDRATPAFAFPSEVRGLLSADFDNDGEDEVFFNNCGEQNRLFRVAASADRPPTESLDRGCFARRAQQITMLDPGDAADPNGFGTGAAVCDIDGDGILELLIARGESEAQPLALFKARTAAANDWLRIRPLTRFGAPARGSVVRMESAGRIRTKGICGGSGYRCQMEPVAHFGLGRKSRAERVQVTWPDGAAVVLMNPGANRTITVPYPRG